MQGTVYLPTLEVILSSNLGIGNAIAIEGQTVVDEFGNIENLDVRRAEVPFPKGILVSEDLTTKNRHVGPSDDTPLYFRTLAWDEQDDINRGRPVYKVASVEQIAAGISFIHLNNSARVLDPYFIYWHERRSTLPQSLRFSEISTEEYIKKHNLFFERLLKQPYSID